MAQRPWREAEWTRLKTSVVLPSPSPPFPSPLSLQPPLLLFSSSSSVVHWAQRAPRVCHLSANAECVAKYATSVLLNQDNLPPLPCLPSLPHREQLAALVRRGIETAMHNCLLDCSFREKNNNNMDKSLTSDNIYNKHPRSSIALPLLK